MPLEADEKTLISENDEEKLQKFEDDDDINKFSNKDIKRNETLEKIPEEDESKDFLVQKAHITAHLTLKASEQVTIQTVVEPGTPHEYFPINGPEVEEFLKLVKENNEKIKGVQNSIPVSHGNETIIIEINKGPNIGVERNRKVEFKTYSEILNETSNMMESIFKQKPLDFEGQDEEIEEDEDDEENEGEDDIEEEIDDDENENVYDPTLKDKQIRFGDTNHYCPVSLYSRNVLVPGNPEIQCKYREKIYRFSSEESKNMFIENTGRYLPSKEPPTVS